MVHLVDECFIWFSKGDFRHQDSRFPMVHLVDELKMYFPQASKGDIEHHQVLSEFGKLVVMVCLVFRGCHRVFFVKLAMTCFLGLKGTPSFFETHFTIYFTNIPSRRT